MINLLDYSNVNTTVINEKSRLKGDMHVRSSLELSGEINGNLKVDGLLRVNGRVVGNVESLDVLVLHNGQIEGNIEAFSQIQQDSESVIIGDILAETADLGGLVEGTVTVNEEAVIRKTGIINGNVIARSFRVETGARIKGRLIPSYKPRI